MELKVITDEGIKVIANKTSILDVITLLSPLGVALYTVRSNFKALTLEKRLSSRVILEYEEMYHSGLKLENHKSKENAKIFETENYIRLSELYKYQISNAKNCFDALKVKKEYLMNGNFVKLTNPGPDVIFDCKVSIEMKVSYVDGTREYFETISCNLPTIKVGDEVYILMSILPKMEKKIESVDNGTPTFRYITPSTSQEVHRSKILYKTRMNEEIEILNTGTSYSVYSKYKGNRELVQESEQGTGRISWIYPKIRMKSFEIYRDIEI